MPQMMPPISWMESAAGRQPLDGDDGLAHGRQQREAGQHWPAAELHDAGAALAVIAALLCAGQREMLAQRIEQRRPYVEFDRVADAVDADVHAAILYCPGFLLGNDRRNASFRARSEERRVGKECVSTCSSRWSTYH